MKEILARLVASLAQLDNFNDRRPALLAEQRELEDKVAKLKNAVSRGDTKSINAMHIAQARLEILPEDLASTQAEYDRVLDDLRTLVVKINPALCHIWNLAYSRTKGSCIEFLKGFLGENYLVEQMADTVTTYSLELAELNKYKAVFEGIYPFNQKDVSVLISRARYAVENLKKYGQQ